MNKNRINEIDLLRFIAAISVVLYHYSFRGYAADGMSIMPYPFLSQIAKYGYLGVELFFMISGFVILMTASKGNLKSFVISRMTRLYPAFWACCTITFIVTIGIGGHIYTSSFKEYLINMTMLGGFLGCKLIDGAYWSLFVEMKFYALVAILLIFNQIRRAELFLIIWLICSILINLLPKSKFSFFLIPEYSAYFISGALYYIIWSEGASIKRFGIISIGWVLAIYTSINRLSEFEKHYNVSMNNYVVVGIISSYFLTLLLISTQNTGYIGRKQWFIVGALTYPLYLLHQNIGFMVFNIAYPMMSEHYIFWSTILLMLGTAYLVNIIVERKLSLHMKNSLNYLIDSIYRINQNPSIVRKK